MRGRTWQMLVHVWQNPPAAHVHASGILLGFAMLTHAARPDVCIRMRCVFPSPLPLALPACACLQGSCANLTISLMSSIQFASCKKPCAMIHTPCGNQHCIKPACLSSVSCLDQHRKQCLTASVISRTVGSTLVVLQRHDRDVLQYEAHTRIHCEFTRLWSRHTIWDRHMRARISMCHVDITSYTAQPNCQAAFAAQLIVTPFANGSSQAHGPIKGVRLDN